MLLRAAIEARTHAHAPFSHFRVGAALRTRAGRIFTGCNIENASFGLTICAERVALFKAISEGEGEFTHLAVVAESPSPCPPCGACRQIIWEFAPDVVILLGNLEGETISTSPADLLPIPFDADQFSLGG
ncbi:MAG: cytidine deaminase [Deltaproteobacteria bacterium]|nr:MAG: cytidine deaminase [Deltaproteobacteria bacterium]